MNAYDFDGTIFHPDSSYLFWRYCLRHYTRPVVMTLPSVLLALPGYRFGKEKDATKLKEALFSFLNRVDDVHATVEAFWEENFHRIPDWYLQQRKEDDLIISASPSFLLTPVAERLGVRLIATEMNPYNGRIRGKNCHDREKVRRFRDAYLEERIEAFYSDSLSDSPMASLAERAFLVKGLSLSPWPGKN